MIRLPKKRPSYETQVFRLCILTGLPGSLLGLGLLVALLSSVVPYSLELNALRRLPPAVFSILLSLEPAFAALFGWLLLGQESGLLRTLAIVLVVAASAGVTLTARRLTPAGSRRGP